MLLCTHKLIDPSKNLAILRRVHAQSTPQFQHICSEASPTEIPRASESEPNRPCAALYLGGPSEGSCRTADHVCEFVNRFPADRRKRRKVEVSLFYVVFETACSFMGRAHRSARLNVICCHPPLRTKTVTIRFFSFGLKKMIGLGCVSWCKI